MTCTIGSDELRRRIHHMDKLPMVLSIFRPLLDELDRPPDQVKLAKVIELISYEESMVAKCLHMANSPLFGIASRVETIRAAVLVLGLTRLRDVLLSACLMHTLPTFSDAAKAAIFWEHSLACALASRHLAHLIKVRDPNKAYVAGLLHDIGVIVNFTLFPDEMQQSFAYSEDRSVPLEIAEREVMGFNHCEAGAMLADEWALPSYAREVIRHHHQPMPSLDHGELIAIISIADKLCFARGVTYAPIHGTEMDILREPAWTILLQKNPELHRFDLARLWLDLEFHFREVRSIVAALFRE